jgi:hypothetical protein
VIVTEHILRAAIGYQRAESTATTECPGYVIDVSAGHAEMRISTLMISSTIGQTGGQQRAEEQDRCYECTDQKCLESKHEVLLFLNRKLT